MKQFKERLYNKVRKKLVKLFISQEKMLKKADALATEFYNYLTEEFDGELQIDSTANGYLMFRAVGDEDSENVLALLTFDLYGNQVHLIVNEDGDFLGLGRTVKKFLDEKKLHVYYFNEPIAYIRNVLAVGETNIKATILALDYLNSTMEKKKNETIH